MRVWVVESAPDRAGLLHERLRRVGHAVDVTADAALGLEALVAAPGLRRGRDRRGPARG